MTSVQPVIGEHLNH